MMKTIRLYFSTKSMARRRSLLKYRRKGETPNPGMDNRLKKLNDNQDENQNYDFDNLPEDVDDLEPNFLEVGKSYKIHERELERRKEILKTQITLDRYVKDMEPSFLTFAEKEQIKHLHKSNPYEWTVEKLSESFPGLPHNIKKVLNTKGTIKSKNYILQYDQKVAENWIAFREGELSVSSMMTKHLQKFSGRQIIFTDKDKLAEHFIPPKVEFPKPKSKLFSTIAEKFLLNKSTTKSDSNNDNTNDKKEENNNDKYIFQAKKQNEFFDEHNHVQNSEFSNNTQVNELILPPQKERTVSISEISENVLEDKIRLKRRITFDEFLKSNVDRTENSNCVEDIVLKEIYKNQIEKNTLSESKIYSSPKLNDDEISESKSSEIPQSFQKEKTNLELDYFKKPENNNSILSQKTEVSPMPKEKNYEITLGSNRSSLDTYVKEWHRNNIDEVKVAHYIKIPQRRYKQGMTYRVKDCFYDDDGEFLYRVPGLLIVK